ncbi:tetratricopeptide repeat protein [Hymenobacter sp. HD11105]
MLSPRIFWLVGLLAALLLGGRSGMATPAPEPDVAKLMAEARVLQRKYLDSEALAKYEQVLSIDAKNYEALWQAALLSVRIGTRYTDETRRSAYFTSSGQYAYKAFVIKSDGGEANYAVALALVNQATLLRARGRLLMYKEMQPYVFRAVARRPDWADTWQLLGRWHYRVDHYNVLERIYSELILGGMPSGASSHKAIDALKRAHELDPKRIQFCYDLARVYQNQRQLDQAIAVLVESQKLEPVTSEELEVSRRCRNLLQQLARKNRKSTEST